jgi:hypothetical protein
MMNLSTAVQVVLDAAINVSESPDAEAIAAAVLLAVKDQAAPHRPIPQSSLEWGEYSMTQIIRERLTDIANELAAVRTDDPRRPPAKTAELEGAGASRSKRA